MGSPRVRHDWATNTYLQTGLTLRDVLSKSVNSRVRGPGFEYCLQHLLINSCKLPHLQATSSTSKNSNKCWVAVSYQMRSFGLAHNEGFKGFSYYLIILIRVFRLLSLCFCSRSRKAGSFSIYWKEFFYSKSNFYTFFPFPIIHTFKPIDLSYKWILNELFLFKFDIFM